MQLRALRRLYGGSIGSQVSRTNDKTNDFQRNDFARKEWSHVDHSFGRGKISGFTVVTFQKQNMAFGRNCPETPRGVNTTRECLRSTHIPGYGP